MKFVVKMYTGVRDGKECLCWALLSKVGNVHSLVHQSRLYASPSYARKKGRAYAKKHGCKFVDLVEVKP